MYTPILSQRDDTVGVIPPPSGITPDFANPPSRVHAIFTVHIVNVIISTLFVGLRFYTVRFITQRVKVEDYLLIAAWFLAVVYSVLFCISTQYGWGRHLWDIPFPVFNINFMQVAAIFGTFYGISIMLAKLSILTFFLQFALWGKLRGTIYIIMAIVVVYSLVASFEWVYACRPLRKYWDLTITGGSCVHWLKILIFSGVMNTTTDAAILILPVLLLRHLRLPKRQRIGVMVVLMSGGFVLIVSIIRLKLTADLVNTMDISWEGVPSIVWCTIEVHTAIVCACLPAGKPFLRKHMPNVIGGSYGTSTRTKRPTIPFIHTQHRPIRHPGEDPESIILEENINGIDCTNTSTTTVDIATEQAIRAEYSSDRGLIIRCSKERGRVGP